MDLEFENKAVLVWVTNPEACDRIVKAGRKMADEHGAELYIVSIQNRILDDWKRRASDLELLHRAARSVEAELNVVYSENPFQSAAKIVTEIQPGMMITGLPGTEGRSAFLDHICSIDEHIQTYVIDMSGNLVRADVLSRL